MKVFDCHFHTDKGTVDYSIAAVKRNIIFNSIEQFKNIDLTGFENDSISLIFDYKDNLNFVAEQIQKKSIQALKIHSRIQHIADEDYAVLFKAFETFANKGLPVIIDAFYYGSDYEYQPNLRRIIEMVKLFPNTKFIIAHSGGIKVLEYFLHLRSFDNVYFDLAFSLAYLKTASVYQDFKVLLRFGNYEKILFGTDYPYVKADDQLNSFLELVDELEISEESIGKMLYDNSNSIFI
jgi:predicted TIM-barrel fold metal-dependent hydrolase